MKISSILVTSLFCCLDTAVSQTTTGLRGLMQEHKAECLHDFKVLDIDKDNVLSVQDLKAVMDYMIDEKGADKKEVEAFASDLSSADYNDDGQIDKQEFMIACEGQDYAAEKKSVHHLKSVLKENNTWEKVKKDLAIKKGAQQHEAAKANKPTKDFRSIGQKVKGSRVGHFAQYAQCGDMADDYISEVDTDGDGALSYEEELEYFISYYNVTKAEAEAEVLEAWGISPGEVQTRADLIGYCEAEFAPSERVVEKEAAKKDFESIGQKVKGSRVGHFAQYAQCGDAVDEFLSEADTDGDGALSYEEELEYLQLSDFNGTKAEAEEVLEAWGISPGEVQTRADLIGYCEAEFAPSEKVVEKEAAKKDFESIGQKVKGSRVGHFAEDAECGDAVDEFLSQADTDGDGALSYEEELEYFRDYYYVTYNVTKAEVEAEEVLGAWGISPGEVKTRADLIGYCEAEFAPSEKVVEKKAAKEEAAALKECAGFFERMDIDRDGELSIQDLETVVDSKIKNNVDDSQLREFVDAMADLDLNNDEIIDNDEFMSACLSD